MHNGSVFEMMAGIIIFKPYIPVSVVSCIGDRYRLTPLLNHVLDPPTVSIKV